MNTYFVVTVDISSGLFSGRCHSQLNSSQSSAKRWPHLKLAAQSWGEILQDECLRNAPGGVRDGDVVVTSGGQLQCQFVVHGSCTGWMNGDGRCLQVRDSHILAGTFTSAFNGVSACAGILYLVSCAVNL